MISKARARTVIRRAELVASCDGTSQIKFFALYLNRLAQSLVIQRVNEASTRRDKVEAADSSSEFGLLRSPYKRALVAIVGAINARLSAARGAPHVSSRRA
jgi:hypothetical protein